MRTSALLEGTQEGVEPGQGRDVQAVGRLVEEQEIRILQEQSRQGCSHSPAAGEGAGVPAHLLWIEAQAGQDALGVVTPGRSSKCSSSAWRSDSAWASSSCSAGELAARSATSVAASRSSTAPRPGTEASTVSTSGPGGRAVTSCGRYPARAPRLQDRIPPSGLASPTRILEQRGLAGSVRAHQADPVARGDREARILKEDLGPEGEREPAGGEERHRGALILPPGQVGQVRWPTGGRCARMRP